MNTSKTHGLPAKWEAVRRRFERWRQTHKPRSRIPDSLWTVAAKMAGTYGLHRTARALRVEYYALKKHMEQPSCAVRGRLESGPATTFMELPPSLPGSLCDLTLELEDAAGAKMRLHLTAAVPPDLAAISRSFWNPAS
ncbi:MAG: hypothetical protein WC718_17835 [Phycisphaerales bacterium]|jgi:hypothetical protein